MVRFDAAYLVDRGRKSLGSLVSGHAEVSGSGMLDRGKQENDYAAEGKGREGSKEEEDNEEEDKESSIDLRNHLRDDILQTVRVVHQAHDEAKQILMIERARCRSLSLGTGSKCSLRPLLRRCTTSNDHKTTRATIFIVRR